MAKPIAPVLTPPPNPRPQSTMAHGEFKIASDAEFVWQDLNHNQKIAWTNWVNSLTDWHVAQLQDAFVLKLAQIPELENIGVIKEVMRGRPTATYDILKDVPFASLIVASTYQGSTILSTSIIDTLANLGHVFDLIHSPSQSRWDLADKYDLAGAFSFTSVDVGSNIIIKCAVKKETSMNVSSIQSSFKVHFSRDFNAKAGAYNGLGFIHYFSGMPTYETYIDRVLVTSFNNYQFTAGWHTVEVNIYIPDATPQFVSDYACLRLKALATDSLTDIVITVANPSCYINSQATGRKE